MTKKKYNNNSPYWSDWTTKVLKREVQALHQAIYEIECYNCKDIMRYDSMIAELYKRGVKPIVKLMYK